MKLLVLVAMLFLTACASTTAEKTSGSGYQSKMIRVIGIGKTFEDAKTNGFNSAIEIAVGSVILTEQEANNQRLVRDEIVKHSAGYVDDYKIISQSQTSRGLSVVMDVDVKSSKIAERILNKSASAGTVPGQRMADQYSTYLGNMQTGDKFINSVLHDHTKYAYNIKQGKVEYKLNGNRDSIIVVPYEIGWDYKWSLALKESLQVVQDGNKSSPHSINVITKNPNDWVASNTRYYFNDQVRIEQILKVLNSQTFILMRIMHYNGSIIHSVCISGLNTNNWRSTRWGENGIFNGQYRRESTAEIIIRPGSVLHQNVKNMDRIEMSVITEVSASIQCTENL